MLNGNGKTSITVVAQDATGWANDILVYLRDHGYQLSTIGSIDDAGPSFTQHPPDAILVTNPVMSHQVLKFFGDKHPLLILITDQFNAELTVECADVIAPPSARYVELQIQRLLHLRAENETLRQENRTISEQSSALQTQIAEAATRHKRSTDEIELLKNAIVRNVSHELKTPLLQVKAAVSLIGEVGADKELIQLASTATARLEAVVKNISQLGSSLDITLGPVIIRDAIEYARRNLARTWEHRGEANRIKVILQDHLSPALADKQAISTALQLLIDNALKFSEKSGKDVEVHASQREDSIQISVIDFGIGIPKDQLDTIFDIFYQVDSSSTRRYGGMGVGLAIVRIIMERHNTKITVTSKENEGSTFSFTLPIVKLS